MGRGALMRDDEIKGFLLFNHGLKCEILKQDPAVRFETNISQIFSREIWLGPGTDSLRNC